MSSYGHFAYYYDRLMDHAPYDEWFKFTLDVLQSYQLKPNQIVELGCGTGEIALRLAENGYQITGVDLSSQMLTIAEEKARSKNLQIPFIMQDIRNLEGFSNVDLFISYCDVMNYITEEADLKKTFENIYRSLSKDGLFIFDIHNLYYAENNLIGSTFADVTDDLAYIWKCHRGDYPGEMFHEMHFFVRHEGESYTHFTEEHHERTYAVNTYEQLLLDVNFKSVQFVSDFQLKSPFNEKMSERIFIIAQK